MNAFRTLLLPLTVVLLPAGYPEAHRVLLPEEGKCAEIQDPTPWK